MDQDNMEQVITPWEIKSEGAIDYKKITKFGVKSIDGELIKRFESVTKVRAPVWLRRGLFFSHKDLDIILNKYEKGEQIYLYTGRGPSSESMHLGHLIPFMFTKELQDIFNAIVIIQMSDDEKYYFKREYELEHYTDLAYKNARDIIAVGFNKELTYIFVNSKEFNDNEMLRNNFDLMSNNTNIKEIQAIFGDSIKTISQINWPIKQAIPAYSNSFPKIFDNKHISCLVPMAIDQFPYFSYARDFVDSVKNFGYLKPGTIHSEFLPALEGMHNKLSSTNNNPTTIFLSDTMKDIENKIKKHAFSGGQETKELQRELGADLHVDIAYQWLLYFEPNDDILSDIAHKYHKGEMLTSDIKSILIKRVQEIVTSHQNNKQNITSEEFDYYFTTDKPFKYQNSDNRDNFKLLYEKEYKNIGCNFDRYFGVYNTDNDSIGELLCDLIETSNEISNEYNKDTTINSIIGNNNDDDMIEYLDNIV